MVYEFVVYYGNGMEKRFNDRDKAITSAGDYWSMTSQRTPVCVYTRPAGSKFKGELIWRDGRIPGKRTY